MNSSEKMLLIKNSNYIPPTATTSNPSSSACNCQTTKCEPRLCKSKTCAQDPGTNMSNIKIVNVCSSSENNTSKNNVSRASQDNIMQNPKGISSDLGMINNVTLSNIKNTTQNTGNAAGMIVYESPNLKNRLYALIGLVLVSLTCIFIIIRKILAYKEIFSKR